MGKSPIVAVIFVVAVLTAVVCISSPVFAQLLLENDDAEFAASGKVQALKYWPAQAPSVEIAASKTAFDDEANRVIRQVWEETSTRYPFSPLVTENFILLHCGNEGWAASTGLLLEDTRRRFYDVFQDAGFSLQLQPGRLEWICFSNTQDYWRYAWQTERRDVSALEGYYSAQTNRVALYQDTMVPVRHLERVSDARPVASTSSEPLGAATELLDATRTAHEAAHQLAFNSGLQRRGVMYPFWLSEGLATYFESDAETAVGSSEIEERGRRLLDAMAVGTLIPLSDFATMTRIPMDDMGQVYDAYAQAWGFFSFLMENRRSELTHYVARLQGLAPGRRSPERLRREFTDSFGSMRALSKEWLEYLDRLEASQS